MNDRRSRTVARVVAGVLLSALAGSPARAEIVVFSGGGFLKVASAEVGERTVGLDLLSGGRIVVRLSRVERILDDEVEEGGAEVGSAGDTFELRFDPRQRLPEETPYAALIYAAAERHALNPLLLAAVARAESAFKPRAVSHKGARGLMQLMPATAARFGLPEAEILEPARNLDVGARYLRWLADRFRDDLTLILAAYNAGEGTVDRFGGVPPYRETRAYVRRILDALGLQGAG